MRDPMIGLLCGIVGEEVFGFNGKSLFLCMIVALQKVDLLFIYLFGVIREGKPMYLFHIND